MSIAAQRFLEKNEIDLKIGQQLYETKDINEILEYYGVSINIGWKDVCIKDILGYDYGWRNEPNDLLKCFNSYFDSEGDTYHSRANSMLDYSSSEMIEKLKASFKNEPICLSEVEDNKYVIGTNGIHRFIILKVSYLGELSKCTTQEEIEEVNKKFTIPVTVQKTDVFKSYCNYLLNRFGNTNLGNFWFKIDRNNPNLSIVDNGSTKLVLTDEELLDYMIANIQSDIIEEGTINYSCRKYPSFNNFMNLYIEKTTKEKRI